MELKVKNKTLPGGHFRLATGQSLHESFVATPGMIYEVAKPIKLGDVTLAKETRIQLAFKNSKAVFYRVLPETV